MCLTIFMRNIHITVVNDAPQKVIVIESYQFIFQK